MNNEAARAAYEAAHPLEDSLNTVGWEKLEESERERWDKVASAVLRVGAVVVVPSSEPERIDRSAGKFKDAPEPTPDD